MCFGVPMRATWRVQMPQEVAAGDVRCVGSFQGWLVGVAPVRDHGAYYRKFDGECFMVNAFSHEVVRLPPVANLEFGFRGGLIFLFFFLHPLFFFFFFLIFLFLLLIHA